MPVTKKLQRVEILELEGIGRKRTRTKINVIFFVQETTTSKAYACF
jgi:hypothetical protein